MSGNEKSFKVKYTCKLKGGNMNWLESISRAIEYIKKGFIVNSEM